MQYAWRVGTEKILEKILGKEVACLPGMDSTVNHCRMSAVHTPAEVARLSHEIDAALHVLQGTQVNTAAQ